MKTFRLALNAGHYINTSKGIPANLNNGKRVSEWWLNDRIADRIEKKLSDYDDIEVLRIDDTTGTKDVPLRERTDKANNFEADFYLSIHHNGGINGGMGGGICAYVYNGRISDDTLVWQKMLYNELIAKTGLRGNRASPLGRANFHEVRETYMPAVLLELGFMDSVTDIPVILSEEFVEQCASAIVNVIVTRAQLTKKEKPDESDVIYRVQVGAFRVKSNADAYLKKVQAAGFTDAYITKSK